MTKLVFVLFISLLVCLYLICLLVAYAVYLRWNTERRAKLIQARKPIWQERIDSWLVQGALVATDEEEPLEFLKYLSVQCDSYSDQELQKLGRLVQRLGFDDLLYASMCQHDHLKQAWAIHLIGLLGLTQFKQEVAANLEHPKTLVVFCSTLALARLINPQESLYQVLFDKLIYGFDTWTTEKLGEVFIIMGSEAGMKLLELIKSKTIEGRLLYFALDMVGELELPAAGPVLLGLVDGHTETALHSIRSLGLIRYKPALDKLILSLQHSEWTVRAQAAKALGNFTDPTAVPYLLEAMGDSVWWVRYNSANSLSRIQPEGIACLNEQIYSNPDPYAKDMAKLVLKKHTGMKAVG